MRKSLWIMLVVFTLLLAACGPAMKPSTDAVTASGEVFMLALPQLVVDFDTEGSPSVMGLKLDDVGKMVNMDLSSLRLNKYYIDWMMAANVQHIEMRQTGDGLALLVNAQPMPHIAWTDASLQQLTELGALFNIQGTDVIKRFLPIVRRLGVDIALRFPVSPTAKAIPMATPEVSGAPATPEKVEASAAIFFEVVYDADGVPSILGISARDLQSLNLDLPVAIEINTLRMLQSKNIQTVELRSKADGLFIYINGNPLPNLVWNTTLLTNAANLYAQLNPTSPVNDMVKQLAPTVNKLDIGIMVHFPLAADAKPIPAKMH